MEIISTSIKVSVSKFFATFLGFTGLVYFSRALSPSVLGIFFLFQSLLYVAAIFADLGVRAAVEKRISQGEDPSHILGSGIIIKAIALSTICIFILIMRGKINSYVGASISSWLVISIIFFECSRTAVQVLNGELRVEASAAMLLVEKLIYVASGILLIMYGLDGSALIYALIFGFLFSAVFSWYLMNTSVGTPSTGSVKSLLNYARYDIILAAGLQIFAWADILIIGFFSSKADVSSYEISWRIAQSTLLFTTAVATSLFPQISSLSSQGKLGAIRSNILDSLSFSLLFVIPSAFGALIVSKQILGIVFGESYTPASTSLIVLMIANIFYAIDAVVGHVIEGMDRPDFAMRSTVFALVANIVLNILLIPYFGITGASVATGSSLIIKTVYNCFYCYKIVRFEFPWFRVAWMFVASGAMLVSVYLMRQVTEISSIIQLLLLIIFAGVVYFLTLLLSAEHRKTFQHILNAR